MPNVLFDPGREGILDRSIDMTADVRVALVADSYVFKASHRNLVDLVEHIAGRSDPLFGRSYTSGVFDAHDIQVRSDRRLRIFALVVFQHTGNDATARLVAHIDRTEGLPFTPGAGQRVDIAWSDGPDRIFRL